MKIDSPQEPKIQTPALRETLEVPAPTIGESYRHRPLLEELTALARAFTAIRAPLEAIILAGRVI